MSNEASLGARRRVDLVRVLVLLGVVAGVLATVGPTASEIALALGTGTLLWWTVRSGWPLATRAALVAVLGSALLAGGASWVRDGYALWPPAPDRRVSGARAITSVTPVATRGEPGDAFQAHDLAPNLQLDRLSPSWQHERRVLRAWLDRGMALPAGTLGEARARDLHAAASPHWLVPNGATKSGLVLELQGSDGEAYALVSLRQPVPAQRDTGRPRFRYGYDEILLGEDVGGWHVLAHRRWYYQFTDGGAIVGTFPLVFLWLCGIGLGSVGIVVVIDGLHAVLRRLGALR